MKKFYIPLIPILFLSLYLTNLPLAFCELDPELKEYSQRVIDHGKDYFMSTEFAVGVNKLTSKTKLGIAYAASLEFGFFEQIGVYNAFHIGAEYSFIKATYESESEFEDDVLVPLRLLPKLGYGFILSERVSVYINGGVGPILAKQKRTLKGLESGSGESDYSLGYALNAGLNVNIKLHGAISLNTGFRADFLSLEPSEYKINGKNQVNGKSTTTISYSMNAGLKFSL